MNFSHVKVVIVECFIQMVKLMVKRGFVADLARIPHSLDLSNPSTVGTINALLRPLETLSRVVNQPQLTQSAIKQPSRYYHTFPHSYDIAAAFCSSAVAVVNTVCCIVLFSIVHTGRTLLNQQPLLISLIVSPRPMMRAQQPLGRRLPPTLLHRQIMSSQPVNRLLPQLTPRLLARRGQTLVSRA